MLRCSNTFGIGVLLAVVCFAGAACRRDMQDQPKIKPYRGSSFFGDKLASRPPVQGTIPRGYLRSDLEFYTGKKSVSSVSPAPASTSPYTDDVDTFPFPITQETVARGRERYEIFCSVCHGLTGHGDGMIVRRGFRRAASFHDDRLRQAPVGHFFDAITNGWGAMPPYAAQIPVQDRWAIISYVRALQLSQQNIKTQPGPSGTPLPQGSSAPQPTPAAGGHE
jgi:mono/diheme cytochrome c family protein